MSVLRQTVPSTRPESGRRRRTLGLLIDWLRGPYQNALFVAVADAVAELDANLLCVAGGILGSPDIAWTQRNVVYELVGAHNVDALVVTAGTMGTLSGPEQLLRYLARYRPLPVASIGYFLPGVPSVGVDNERGMREVVEHMVVAHGHRRIAFIRGPASNEEAERRLAVYRDVLRVHGIPYDPSIVHDGGFIRESGIQAARDWLQAGARFDAEAIVAASDLMALGAMETLQAAGRRVPEDLAVVGFDDINEARFARPQLTTARQPYRSLARQAVHMAMRSIDGLPVPERVMLAPELVVRRSCGCAGDDVERDDPSRVSVPPGAPRPELLRRLAAIVAALEGAHGEARVDEEAAVHLFDGLIDEIDRGVTGEFVAALADAVRVHGGEDHLALWREAIAAVRPVLRGWTALDAERLARVERVMRHARMRLADLAEYVQARQRLKLGRVALALSEMSEALHTTFQTANFAKTMIDHLPRLEVPACHLALYERPLSPLAGAKLRLAYDTEAAVPEDATSVVFPTSAVAPPGLLFGDARRTYVVEPLFFDREQLGFAVMAVGPRDGLVYESLRDQMSGALKGALLVAQVVEEGKRRQLAERQQAEKEMKIAAQIQTMILPRAPHAANLEIAATMLPAADVGGDYYDVLPVEDGCWIGVGDVAGHGLVSGLIMLMIQSVVAGLVRQQPGIRPADVVSSVNAVLFENVRTRLGQDQHATFCVLRYRTDGTLVFAGAHETLLVFRARTGRCEHVSTNGVWLGMIREVASETVEATCRLEDGDVLMLYTDGVVEARSVDGSQYGLDRLARELERVATSSAGAIRDHVVASVQSWMSRQDDDMTVLVARYGRAAPAIGAQGEG